MREAPRNGVVLAVPIWVDGILFTFLISLLCTSDEFLYLGIHPIQEAPDAHSTPQALPFAR